MIGRVVGTYEIVERIGEGGMGTVWRAVDVMLEREVAIKAVRSDLASEPQIVERFRSEAKILARVHHPAIATIYSFFREGGELYLAMEFVRGRSLAQVLREERALPWPRAVALAAAALEGIEQVHRTGIIHRDLKPDNLMLTAAGDIKVMDFGIARAIGSAHLTGTGLMVGTVRYMSPEQLNGHEVDHRSDLYSLGVVLYEMLTGRIPFQGSSEYESIRAQVEDPPVPVATLVSGIPGWLDQAVLKALAKSPGDRFQSAAEMATSLAASAMGATATARPATEASAVILPTGRRPLSQAAAAPLVSPVPASPGGSGSYRALGLPGKRWLAVIGGIGGLALLAAMGFTWRLRGAAVPTTAPPPVAATAQPVAQPAAPAAATPAPAAQPTEAAPVVTAKTVIRRSPPAPEPTRNAAPQPAAGPEAPPAAPASPSTPREEPGGVASGAAGPAEAALPELAQLGDQLNDAGGKLADAWSDFRGQKKDRGETLTPTDDKIKDEIDALRDAATHFNRRVNASALRRATWHLRREGEEQRRAEVLARVREVDDAVKRLHHLLATARPSEAVTTVWQEVHRIDRRIDELCSRR